MPMRALELDNLTMAYGRRVLFENICATAAPGEFLVVTGANGAGKSTLLRIIAGLVRPEEGRVRVIGDGGASAESRAERARMLGYATPDAQLYAELTGDENLAFFARLRGLAPGSTDGLLARVGLPSARGRDLVSRYSSGMRHRLKLAVSLLGDPPLLIWDEPTATLDQSGGDRVEEILAGHQKRGGIAVLATNDPGEAERWSQAGGRRVPLGC